MPFLEKRLTITVGFVEAKQDGSELYAVADVESVNYKETSLLKNKHVSICQVKKKWIKKLQKVLPYGSISWPRNEQILIQQTKKEILRIVLGNKLGTRLDKIR